jgi:Flp pilus assembly protein TadG
LKGFGRNERGSVILITAIAIATLLGFAALAVDGSYLYTIRNRLQAAADAAALAGASQLPTAENVKAMAQIFAGKNLPSAYGHGTVLRENDIAVGNWNKVQRTFTAGAAPANAVRVIARRTGANGNPVQTYFARVLGFEEVDVVAEAIATGESPGNGTGDCENSGIVSNRQVFLQSNNDVLNGACIYGRLGVGIQSNNTVSPDSSIGMLDLATFSQGSNNELPPGTVQAYDRWATLASQAQNIVNDLRNQIDLPDYIQAVQTVTEMPLEPAPGTAYIVNGPAAVKMGEYMNQVLNNVLKNMVIVSTANIDIPSNVGMYNVILAANGKVSIGSNSQGPSAPQFGNPNYCTDGDPTNGDGTVQIVTPDNLDIASNRNIYGSQFIVGGLTNIQSNDFNVALSIHGGDNIYIQSNEDIIGCANNQHLRWGPGAGSSAGPKLRLVF